MSLSTSLETILFVAGKPLSNKSLAKVLDVSVEEVATTLTELKTKYNSESSGIWLIENNAEWQLVSSPNEKVQAEKFLKAEIAGELTKPQLETLTVISYCGPITKPELETIRGVNCSLILRNLLLRGLIDEHEVEGGLLPAYSVTLDYLRFLGLSSVAELPDYAELHDHAFIRSTLNTTPTTEEKPNK